MVDAVLREAKREEKLMKATNAAIAQHSISGKIASTYEEMRETFKATALQFNQMREQMERAKNAIWETSVDMQQFVSSVNSVSGYDVMAFVAKVWDVPLSEVEDAEQFEALLSRIVDEKNPAKRLRLCAKAKKSLDEATASWKSKIASMNERLLRPDGNANEREICERKIITMSKAVETLKTRTDSVREVFHTTKRALLKFIENQSKSFN